MKPDEGASPGAKPGAVAPPATVDAYVATFAPAVQALLQAVRATVKAAVPDGEERISYHMPALFCGGVVVYYAAFKRHIGLYPPVADPDLRQQVARWAGPKGNLQFPYDEPLPLDLIAAIARARRDMLRANVRTTRTRPGGCTP